MNPDFRLDRARAALAEPDGPAVPEGREPASVVGEPSDEELLALVPQGSESDFYLPQGLPSNWVDGDFIAPPEAVVAFARAVLARFGHHFPDARKMVSDAYQMGRRDASADSQQAAEAAEGDVAELVAWLRMQGEAQKPGPNSLLSDRTKKERHAAGVKLNRAADLLEQLSSGWVVPTVEQFAPAPPADVTPGPSIEAVGSLIAWLSEQACQAADAGQPTDAGMLTWAAQVIGERVDEDAPVPPAEGEVAELIEELRMIRVDVAPCDSDVITRAADLLEQFSSGWVVPTVKQAQQLAPVPVAERPWEQDGWCDQQGRCWMGRPLPDAPDRWDWSSAVTNDNATHCLPHDVQTLPTDAGQSPA